MTTLYSFPDAPKRATRWHLNSTKLTGNALVNGVVTSQLHNYASFQNTAANGDSFTQDVWLRDGAYTFYALGFTSTNYGRIDWYLDNVLFASLQDWYSAGATANVIKTASVTISNGLLRHVLKSVVNGKNASSSDYFIFLTELWFKQAAD